MRTGETVSYRYDALGRLANAAATASSVGAAWAMSFGYDGFGNRYSQNMTAGTGPSVNIGFDAGNHINYPAGYSYDGNGNLTSVPRASGPVQYDYDYDNRLKGYTYGIDGKRLVKVTPFESSQSGPKVGLEVYFYGPGGQIQGIYDYNPYRTYSSDGYPRDWAFSVSRKESRVYFAGRWVGGVDVNSRLIYRVAEDRLGSVRATGFFNSNTGNLQSGFSGYFPYGEQRYGGGANFATYTRDGDTGLDYAQQRQYGSAHGVFTTADPYVASGIPSISGSWNRYAYVGGDPVNNVDINGLWPCGTFYRSSYNEKTDTTTFTATSYDCPDSYLADTAFLRWFQWSRPRLMPVLPVREDPQIPIIVNRACRQVSHPGLPDDTVQNNIAEARAFRDDNFGNEVALNTWLASQFKPKGPWDYKNKITSDENPIAHKQLQDFGNFNFGAVLAGLGNDYYYTQNAAGIAQIFICRTRGACGEGTPLIEYPYGDQVLDAVQIKRGFDYETAIRDGFCP